MLHDQGDIRQYISVNISASVFYWFKYWEESGSHPSPLPLWSKFKPGTVFWTWNCNPSNAGLAPLKESPEQTHVPCLFNLYSLLQSIQSATGLCSHQFTITGSSPWLQQMAEWCGQHDDKQMIKGKMMMMTDHSKEESIKSCFRTLVWLVSRISPARNISSTTLYTCNKENKIFLFFCPCQASTSGRSFSWNKTSNQDRIHFHPFPSYHLWLMLPLDLFTRTGNFFDIWKIIYMQLHNKASSIHKINLATHT